MSLRADLLRTVLIQGLGAAALLAAVIYLGAALGPEAQGRFNRTKAEIEFVAAFAMLGLPQAMFYFVQRGELPLRQALRIAAGAALLGALGALVYAVFTGRALDGPSVVALALATAACVWHGELRALLLTLVSSSSFNTMTALPQWLMLGLALGWAGAGGGDAVLAAGFATAYLAPAVWAQAQLLRQPPGVAAGGTAPASGALVRFGAAAWLAATLGAAALVIAQRGVEHAHGPAALGVFTMALALAQVPLVPVSYAAPLLFRHWMGVAGPPPLRWLFVPPLAIGCAALLVLVLVPAAASAGIGFGERYAALGGLLPLLLVGTAGESLLRLLGAHANAAGRPWQVVAAEGLRGAGLLAGVLLLPSTAGLPASAGVWGASAWAAALLLLLGRRAARPVV